MLKLKRLYLVSPCIVLILCCLVNPILLAHSLGTMGGSRWVIGKNKINITLEMS